MMKLCLIISVISSILLFQCVTCEPKVDESSEKLKALQSLKERVDWLELIKKADIKLGINITTMDELKESLSIGHIFIINSHITITNQESINGKEILDDDDIIVDANEQQPNLNTGNTNDY